MSRKRVKESQEFNFPIYIIVHVPRAKLEAAQERETNTKSIRKEEKIWKERKKQHNAYEPTQI